eukprot:Filipodium_phascolosomae@DN919_c0_g1_i1.p1
MQKISGNLVVCSVVLVVVLLLNGITSGMGSGADSFNRKTLMLRLALATEVSKSLLDWVKLNPSDPAVKVGPWASHLTSRVFFYETVYSDGFLDGNGAVKEMHKDRFPQFESFFHTDAFKFEDDVSLLSEKLQNTYILERGIVDGIRDTLKSVKNPPQGRESSYNAAIAAAEASIWTMDKALEAEAGDIAEKALSPVQK